MSGCRPDHDADLLAPGGERTRRIVQNLLEFARQRTPRRSDLADSACRANDRAETPRATGGPDRCRHAAAWRPSFGLVDADQIRQVLLNLLLNAIQAISASKTAGTITVSARLAQHAGPDGEPRVRLAVEDAGPGIKEFDFEAGSSSRSSPRRKTASERASACRSVKRDHGCAMTAISGSKPGADRGAAFPGRGAEVTTPASGVRLRPMTEDEYPAFFQVAEAGYAEGIELHGGQTHEAAVQQPRRIWQRCCRKVSLTPGHAIFIVEADGVEAGPAVGCGASEWRSADAVRL